MAKKTLDDFQKELDALVIQTKHLDNAVEQASASVDYFKKLNMKAEKDFLDGVITDWSEVQKTIDQLASANRKLANEEFKQAEHKATLNQKEDEIIARANASGLRGDKLIIRSRDPHDPQSYSAESYSAAMQNTNGTGGGGGGVKNALASKGGGSLLAGILNVLGDFISAGTDIYIAERKKSLSTWMQNQDIYINAIETSGKIFQRNMKTFAKGMQDALSSSFASITQGVQEGAYAAAQSSVDVSAEFYANKLDTEIDLLKRQNYENIRTLKGEQERMQLTNQEFNSGAGLVSNIAGLFGPAWGAIGGLIQGITGAVTKIREAEKEIEVMKAEKEIELNEKQLELYNNIKKQAMDAAKEAVNSILEFSKSIENVSLKTDAAAKSMANMLGMSGANVDRYTSFIYNTASNMSFTNSNGKTTYLDKTPEDIAKMQSAYIDASDRNITMNRNEFVKAALLGKELGDDNLAASLLGDMDYFNQTIENSTDLIHRMFTEANKAGVSNRKFAKDLQQNLKLAQKYTFKGGVESLMKMSIWAQKTRFNMQGLEAAVDKILDGGIEGVIKQSAQLQVLGGNMGMYSDPLGMLYDALSDPESLAKRYNKMLEGMGTFNSKTGEVEINGPDVLRLKAYAQATGISYEDARKQVTQKTKNTQIDSYLKNAGADNNYTEQQKALIYNKAQYDSTTGKWQVTLDNGKTYNDISDLSDAQIDELLPVEERIEDKVSKIMDYTAMMAGVTQHGQQVVAEDTRGNLIKNIQERMDENLRFFNENLPVLREEVTQANDFVTAQNKIQHDIVVATNKILTEEFEIIKASAKNLQKDIENTESNLRQGLNAVAEDLNVMNGIFKGANEKLAKSLNMNAELMMSEKEKAEKEEEAQRQAKIKAHEDMAKELEKKGQHVESKLQSSMAADLRGDHMAARGLEKSAFGHFMRDGVISSNGSPMFVESSKITPINDGSVSLAKTDPNDIGLFAKPGGPFDILFRLIFGRINDVYGVVSDISHFFRPKGRDGESLHGTAQTAINNSNLTDISRTIGQISNFDDITNNATQKQVANSMVNNVSKVFEQMLSFDHSKYDESKNTVSNSLLSGISETFWQNSSSNDASHGEFSKENYFYPNNLYKDVNSTDIKAYPQNDMLANDSSNEFGVRKFTANNILDNKNSVLADNSSIETSKTIIGNSSSVEESLIDRLVTEIKEVSINGISKGMPFEVKLSGSIDLKSGDQSIDVTSLFKEDPNFIRGLTELMSYQFSRNTNGGKSEMFPNRFTLG